MVIAGAVVNGSGPIVNLFEVISGVTFRDIKRFIVKSESWLSTNTSEVELATGEKPWLLATEVEHGE